MNIRPVVRRPGQVEAPDCSRPSWLCGRIDCPSLAEPGIGNYLGKPSFLKFHLDPGGHPVCEEAIAGIAVSDPALVSVMAKSLLQFRCIKVGKANLVRALPMDRRWRIAVTRLRNDGG